MERVGEGESSQRNSMYKVQGGRGNSLLEVLTFLILMTLNKSLHKSQL